MAFPNTRTEWMHMNAQKADMQPPNTEMRQKERANVSEKERLDSK